ncbi:MAG: hypothetical protein QY326_09515 [Bdellovibrionota bacterium]|nr:MAG: hypothetical protein QY326_09515 [Bdellovibrionota bacterium]
MRLGTTTILLLLAIPSIALSDEISIRDTSGTVRSVAEVADGGNVEFTLTDAHGKPADGVAVTLTDESGDSDDEIAVGGLVLFEGLSPGIYTVSTTAPGITFTNIAISSTALVAGGTLGAGAAASGAGLSAGAIGVGGAVVAAGAAGAIAVSDDDSDDPALSPSS